MVSVVRDAGCRCNPGCKLAVKADFQTGIYSLFVCNNRMIYNRFWRDDGIGMDREWLRPVLPAVAGDFKECGSGPEDDAGEISDHALLGQ